MAGSVGPDVSMTCPSASVADDVQLVQAVLRRDRKAAAELVARHSDELFGYLVRRLSPRIELAEELLQEVFLAAWQNLDSYAGESPLRSWLFGIARHKVQGHYRRLVREPDGLDDLDQDSDSPLAQAPWIEEHLDRMGIEERARRTLDALPERYRAALLWRYWEQESAERMAAHTGRSVKGIERLLARAREQFKRRWIAAEEQDGKEERP